MAACRPLFWISVMPSPSDTPDREGQCLPPVQFHESLADQAHGQFQFAAIIAAVFYGQVGQRNQQRVLVGGGELALGEQPLDVPKELDLFGRGGGRGRHESKLTPCSSGSLRVQNTRHALQGHAGRME